MRTGDVVGGRFRIESLAGTGGMGSVWKAFDQDMHVPVALKLLHGRDPRDVARFLREAELIAGLAHPGIVRYVSDGKTPENERYLVMEWLEGESLADRLERAPLSLGEALTLVQRASEALGAMHAHGLVHRDLKPSNLFLEGKDPERVKVIDLGIARRTQSREVTRTGVLLGTPGYIAPEQALGDPGVDARADVFALGCVLFKCTTGEGAFGTEDDLTVLLRVVKGTARRAREIVPQIPAEVDETLAWMLAREPDDRPRDAGVLANALSRLASIYGSARPGDDPLDELVTTKNRAILIPIDEPSHAIADEPSLGSTSPFPLTTPRVAPVSDAEPLSADDLEEVRTEPGNSDASRAFAAGVARAISAAEAKQQAVQKAPPPPAPPPLSKGTPPNPSPKVGPLPGGATSPPLPPPPVPPPPVPSPPVIASVTTTAIGLGVAPSVAAMQASETSDPDSRALPFLRSAETFLQQNDFRNALVQARRGIEVGATGSVFGALRARQAEAHRWRGELADAERAADDAIATLAPGSELWLIAVREGVVAAGSRSDALKIGALAEALMRVLPGAAPSPVSVGTLSITATFLMHTGHGALLGRFLRWVEPLIANIEKEPPAIAARLHQMRALRATYDGNPAAYLSASEKASEQFALASDMRNSLIQRVNAAFAKIELGAYAGAETELRSAIAGAERMGLNNVVLGARANLGIVLNRIDKTADSRTLMLEVLKESVSEGDRRLEAAARTQLALILLDSGDLTGALREAKGAVELTPANAPSKVLAYGVLARVQLANDRAIAALEAAEHALDLLNAIGGIEEGESLVRLVFAQAKHASGDLAGAREAIYSAERRLSARATLITDPTLRKTFLHNVPENAETERLAREWQQDGSDWSV
ncbi:MAG: serine/threonine protein kinase [Polyangiaceae bacterium]|nr:serine/threonine protein kinase [Polyangiaceae bacterium]